MCWTGKHTDYIISKLISICCEMRTLTSEIKLTFLRAAVITSMIRAAAVELAG
jgi:hypothetical protein